jgi:hypothetical protein
MLIHLSLALMPPRRHPLPTAIAALPLIHALRTQSSHRPQVSEHDEIVPLPVFETLVDIGSKKEPNSIPAQLIL